MMREILRRVWGLYLLPGLLIGGIKFLSVFTWFFYQPIAAAIGPSNHFGFVNAATILGLGLVGTAIAIIGWPFVLYSLLTGGASLSAILFYPWVNPN